MADKDFVVKNGIVVNTGFAANGTQFSIGATSATSNSVTALPTLISVGNSTVNTNIATSYFSVSNSLNTTYTNMTITGIQAVSPTNTAFLTATGLTTGNTVLNTDGLYVGNSSVNVSVNTVSVALNSTVGGVPVGGVVVNTNQISFGNSVANVVLTKVGSTFATNADNITVLLRSNTAVTTGIGPNVYLNRNSVGAAQAAEQGGIYWRSENSTITYTGTKITATGGLYQDLKLFAQTSIRMTVNAGSKEMFTVTNTYNVGIACTTPSYTFDVNGTTRVTKLLAGDITATTDTAGVRTNGDIYMDNIASTLAYNLYYDTTGPVWRYRQNGPGFAWRSDGVTPVMQLFTAPSGTGGTVATVSAPVTFAANGNVGFGTNTPAYPIDVSSGVALNPTAIRIQPSAHAFSRRAAITLDNWSLLQDSNGDGVKNFAIYGGATPSTKLYIDPNGNISFGTTTGGDFSKFTVWGGKSGLASATAAFVTGGAALGEKADLALYSTFVGGTDSGPRRSADIISGYDGGAWGTEYLSFNVGVNGYANDIKAVTSEKMRIDSVGRVLIGLNSARPNGGLLQSMGEIHANAWDAAGSSSLIAYDWNGTASSPTYASAVVRKWGDSVVADTKLYNAQSINAAGWAEIGAINATSGVSYGTNNNTPAIFGTNGTERMRITADGKIGLGTTIPRDKLVVGGYGTNVVEMGMVGGGAWTAGSATACFNVSDINGNNGDQYDLYIRGIGYGGSPAGNGGVAVNLKSISLQALTTNLGGNLISGGGIHLQYNQLNAGYYNDTDSELAINYAGYNAGTTKWRNTSIYNGKTGLIAQFNGSTSELRCMSINTYRHTYGNYGSFWRNDGTNLWLMLTNSGDQNGSYNDFRPFRVNYGTGAVYIDGTGAGTTISGATTISGNLTLGSSSVAVGLQANSSYGTAGQLLTSNGTATYWSTSANNALYLGGTAAASYQLNSTLAANVATMTANNATYINGNTVVSVMESLRANRSVTGGGTITVDDSGYVFWNYRFIVISSGYGSHFSTNGYFDIDCPTSGTITGVGGATNKTATTAGIPLGSWEALYYILPIGSSNVSIAANYRVVLYSSSLEIPSNWILLCINNPESGNFYFNNGIILKAGQSFAGATFTSANMPSANNASYLGGYAASQTSGVSNRIVQADSSGYIYNTYFNSTDNAITSGVTAIMSKQSDNYYRSASAAAVASFISGQNFNTTGAANSSTYASSSVSNTFTVGTAAYHVANGNFGIGNSTPSSKLSVNGYTYINTTDTNASILFAGTTKGLRIVPQSTGYQIEGVDNTGVASYQPLSIGGSLLQFTVLSVEKMRMSAAGGFSVGTTSDPGAGAIYATGNITAYFSDDRLKTKLGNIVDALNKVKTLNGFNYQPNEIAQAFGYKLKDEVGISAQEVQKVMPSAVVPAPIDENYLTVHYDRLIPLLIEAIKELSNKVESLENQLKGNK